jgi:two-component system chemotaxis sensor kinase CheA
VFLRRAADCVAIPVDELVGQQLVLLRPLRGMMSKLRNVTGVALLAGGEVGMVLSPAALCTPGPTSGAQDRLH